MSTQLEQWVEENGVTVEIVKDRGFQVESDGWEHHAYVLDVKVPGGGSFITPWRQGTGITTSPTENPADVLHALVSDAVAGDQSFEDFCADYGYDTDSRKAFALWEVLASTAQWLKVLGLDLDHLRDLEH